jgi:hypothetical protein
MKRARNRYKVLVGKSEGKRALGRCRQEDNIKIFLKEMQWVVVDSGSCGSGYGSCEHGNKLSGFIKDGEFLD